jgi:hypothetical protein
MFMPVPTGPDTSWHPQRKEEREKEGHFFKSVYF